MVQLFRPQIADIDAPDLLGATPLMFAAAGGGIVKLLSSLLMKGADPYKKDANNNGDAATNAIFLQDNADLLPLLFSKNENVDDRRYQFQTINPCPFSFLSAPAVQKLTPLLYATFMGAKILHSIW